jgi:hypothetical protein
MALLCAVRVRIIFLIQLQFSNTNNRIAKDRNTNLLISRVAGLGTLHHKPIGFTGPLSQHLLGYNSMINAVRSTLRDLVEVAATHMFMTAAAKRDIPNLSIIAMK